MMSDASVRAVETSIEELLKRHERLVLAVSGGIDSAVLLHAVARQRRPEQRIVVASVDHGSGNAATEATAQVLSTAARRGLPVVSTRLSPARNTEAEWRAGRWGFLRSVADQERAPVVTAHTRDDHIETVVMRILRGSAARGLAGLLAPSRIKRPLLNVGRTDVQRYAVRHRVEFADDPTNTSRRYFRNRIRLDLLPAIRQARPAFEAEILELSREAAEVRARLDTIADSFLIPDSQISINANALRGFPDTSVRALLPAVFAKAGVTLDRRGLARLVEIVRGPAGTRGQLSGGIEAIRTRSTIHLRRDGGGTEEGRKRDGGGTEEGRRRLRPQGETVFAGFRFSADPSVNIRRRTTAQSARDPWRMYIPQSAEVVVRQWTSGDRLTTDLKGSRRRVKRFLADAGIVGPLREGWPVVLCGENVVWIPGVRASQEAIQFEDRMVEYTCERVSG